MVGARTLMLLSSMLVIQSPAWAQTQTESTPTEALEGEEGSEQGGEKAQAPSKNDDPEDASLAPQDRAVAPETVEGEEGSEQGGERTQEPSKNDDAEDASLAPQDRAVDPKDFIKGDILHPGTRRILSRKNHVGVGIGGQFLDNDFYMTVSPGMAWYFDFGLAFSVHVPLRLRMLRGGSFEFGGGKIRRQDWDEIPDFLRVIRFLTFGRKESNLYFTLNTMRPTTLGHGMMIKQYQADIDQDRSMTGFIGEAYNKYAGFQIQANDITFQNRIVGALAFIKPLSFFMDSPVAQSFSLGAEYVADFNAPRCIRFGEDSENCVQGEGQVAGFDAFSGESLDNTFIRSDSTTGRPVTDNTFVHAAGASAEIKFYKKQNETQNIDLKAYSTFHQFINDGGGWGVGAGMLARLNFGESLIHALRIRAEYRTFTDGFVPGYFDSLYEIQKYAYAGRAKDYQVTPTKAQSVFGDPQNGFDRVDHGQSHGFNFETWWTMFKGSRSKKLFGLGLGLSDSTRPFDTNFYVHTEFPMLSWLQIFGSLSRTNVRDIGNIFTADMFQTDETTVLSGLRLRVLPVLFINAHYSRTFRVVRTPGAEYHLGNDLVVDGSGQSSPFFEQDRLFENVDTVFVELEFGWEFK